MSRASRYYWQVLNINFNLHLVGNDWNELCCEIQVKIIVHFLYARKIQILIVYVNDSWNILYIDIKNNKRKPQKIDKYLNYNISVKKLQKRSILKISWKWISHLKNSSNLDLKLPKLDLIKISSVYLLILHFFEFIR